MPAQTFLASQEAFMADHGKVEYATADGNDYKEHEQTYRFFIGLVKWNVYVIVAILLFMAYFLV
jgi:hypothetical protein